jgi:alkanesulfonate monooxygenase SsuD/methylene tetrahydromethanopterin reductase-like flavin-dependent oxidoreductase (luciferase family)
VIALGVQTWGTDLLALRRYWRAADDLGYARIVYGDGLWGFTHDGWTMLAALAGATRRVRIGPAVTYAFDPSSHHPSWLAKRAVAVDHLSGGRLDLRLGVGAEDAATAACWRSHGIPYPGGRERVERLDEVADLLRRLLAGETVTRSGRFYRLREARIEPRPLQQPTPPIWIAAMSPGALGVAARYAEGWEASYLAPPDFQARWERLAASLVRAGRAPASLARSVEVDVVLAAPGWDAATALERFRGGRGLEPGHPLLRTALLGDAAAVGQGIAAYAAAGATDLTLAFADFPATEMLERFAADVLPAMATRGEKRP